MNRYTLSVAFGIAIGLAAVAVVAGGGNGRPSVVRATAGGVVRAVTRPIPAPQVAPGQPPNQVVRGRNTSDIRWIPGPPDTRIKWMPEDLSLDDGWEQFAYLAVNDFPSTN